MKAHLRWRFSPSSLSRYCGTQSCSSVQSACRPHAQPLEYLLNSHWRPRLSPHSQRFRRCWHTHGAGTPATVSRARCRPNVEPPVFCACRNTRTSRSASKLIVRSTSSSENSKSTGGKSTCTAIRGTRPTAEWGRLRWWSVRSVGGRVSTGGLFVTAEHSEFGQKKARNSIPATKATSNSTVRRFLRSSKPRNILCNIWQTNRHSLVNVHGNHWKRFEAKGPK